MAQLEIILRVDMTATEEEFEPICWTLNEVCEVLENKLRGDRYISYQMIVDGENYKQEFP